MSHETKIDPWKTNTKNNEAKFSTIQISRENWKKNQSIKWYIKKTKQIAIKRIRTKSSIKIKRNKIMMNKIKNKINQENDKKKSQSKEWWSNWIQKLNEIKYWGMKFKKNQLKNTLKAKQMRWGL